MNNNMNSNLQDLTDARKTSLRAEMMSDPQFLHGRRQGIQQLQDGTLAHVDDIINAITPEQPEEKFAFLSQWFRRGTWMHSASSQMDKHPAAALIVRMGEAAIPMVLAELINTRHHWYGILHQLTGAQPVPTEHAGRMDLVRQDWIDWGPANGYIQ